MILKDQWLIHRIAQGDKDAMRTLYQTYKDSLYLLADAMLHDSHLAEDVVHDVFVSFVQNVRTIRLKSSLKGYLATSTANRARDLLRKRKFCPANLELSEEPAVHNSPDHPVERQELSDRITKGLYSLPLEQQEAVLLHTTVGLNFREIAKLQKVPLPTAQGRYRYGIDKLRSKLNGELENETDR